MADINPKHGPVVVFDFKVADATWSASNVDLTTPSGGLYAVMPVSGSVVGLAVVSSGAITAGTATFKVHKYSTEYGGSSPAVTLNETGAATLVSYGFVRPHAVKFSAGDTLGVSYTSDATFAPTNTADIQAQLFVQLDTD